MAAYTGGALNLLNGKMAISAPKNSVPVMNLIKVHQPKTHFELEQLISSHFHEDCVCGIKSQGTIMDFGKNLYESQITFWGEYRYSLKKCIQWEYDLFIVQSLKGAGLENKALRTLRSNIPNLIFEPTAGFLDDELRVDIIIRTSNRKIIGGIQVKPKSFVHMRSEVLFVQMRQNKRWKFPVWFLYYDKELKFTNLEFICQKLNLKKT